MPKGARRRKAGQAARPIRPSGRIGAALDRLRQNRGWNLALRVCVTLGIVGMQWLQLEFSCLPIEDMFGLVPGMLAVNLVLMLLPSLLLALILRRWWLAFMVTSPVVFLWAAANCLVVHWHGSPITYSLLRSAGTALGVLERYSFDLSRKLMIKLAAFFVLLLLCLAGAFLLRWLDPVRPAWRSRGTAARLAGLLGSGAFLWVTLFSPAALKPARVLTLIWTGPFELYGYLPCLWEDWITTRVPFHEPEGYDLQMLEELAPEPAGTADAVCPDIILILNETLYDLSLYTELTTDRPCLDQLYALPNAVHGYALVPGVGGGTNDSEYELLTSNSLYLLSGGSPFLYLQLDNANSVVRYLEGFGYETTSMHVVTSKNYNRNNAYPALGFDRMLFDGEFQHSSSPYNYYGGRGTDHLEFGELCCRYRADSPAPQLFYLLTYGNHGGYRVNDPSMALVHAKQDFGDLTRDVNEYLTSLSFSNSAIAELTAYFEQIERPVILLMVGDHAPSFISELPARPELSEQERELYSRSTPFVIWANFPIESGDAGFVSLADMVPLLLKTAGMPLSAYYQTILSLEDEVPLRFSDGSYQDKAGGYGRYAPEDPQFELLRRYYAMEYNNLEEKERIQALFEPAR